MKGELIYQNFFLLSKSTYFFPGGEKTSLGKQLFYYFSSLRLIKAYYGLSIKMIDRTKVFNSHANIHSVSLTMDNYIHCW